MRNKNDALLEIEYSVILHRGTGTIAVRTRDDALAQTIVEGVMILLTTHCQRLIGTRGHEDEDDMFVGDRATFFNTVISEKQPSWKQETTRELWLIIVGWSINLDVF